MQRKLPFDNKKMEEKAKLVKDESLGQFNVGEELGKGAFGQVFLATHRLTGERVAIKMMDVVAANKQDEKNDIRNKREIEYLSKFHHNNIVQVYQVIKAGNFMNIVQEYISGSELRKYVDEKKGLDEKEASVFFQQLLASIEFIHKLQICHRDLKPENLLLNHKKEIKLIDFGLSNYYKKGQFLNTHCGSPIYAAPEMLESDKKYNPIMTDIWSIGVILFFMVTDRTPFEGNDALDLLKQAKSGKINFPDTLSRDCKDLIKKILTPDPKKRIKIPDIKKHPWFSLGGNPLKSVHTGLDVTKYVIPIDEDIVKFMLNMGYTEARVKEDVIRNEHNNCTTTYYLLLRKKSRKKPSIADLVSEDFEKYVADPQNELAAYNNSLDEVIKQRIGIIEGEENPEDPDDPNGENKEKEKNEGGGGEGEKEENKNNQPNVNDEEFFKKRKEEQERLKKALEEHQLENQANQDNQEIESPQKEAPKSVGKKKVVKANTRLYETKKTNGSPIKKVEVKKKEKIMNLHYIPPEVLKNIEKRNSFKPPKVIKKSERRRQVMLSQATKTNFRINGLTKGVPYGNPINNKSLLQGIKKSLSFTASKDSDFKNLTQNFSTQGNLKTQGNENPQNFKKSRFIQTANLENNYKHHHSNQNSTKFPITKKNSASPRKFKNKNNKDKDKEKSKRADTEADKEEEEKNKIKEMRSSNCF